MKERLEKLVALAIEEGQMKERTRIAREFYEYKNREKIPVEYQKEIIHIITTDLFAPITI